MITRIEKIRGLGLFNDVNCAAHKFERVTLIYGENGRGKSTVAALMRSLALEDGELIKCYSTIDSTNQPEAILQFENGQKNSLSGGKWSGTKRRIMVFDNEFVNRNVYSGSIVTTEHRKNLLEFALGDRAVQLRELLDAAKTAATAAANTLKNSQREFDKWRGHLSLTEFEVLPEVENVEAAIAAKKQELAAAQNLKSIEARRVPGLLHLAPVDIDEIFEVLRKEITDVHTDAQKLLQQHLDVLANKNAEHWISTGLPLIQGDQCPFCGQDVSTNDLIRSYQAYFDESYQLLKSRAYAVRDTVDQRTDDRAIEKTVEDFDQQYQICDSWKVEVTADPPEFDQDAFRAAMRQFRKFVLELAERKVNSPAESVGTEAELTKAKTLWNDVIEITQHCNNGLKSNIKVIKDYKDKIVAVSPEFVQVELTKLELAKLRHEEQVLKAFKELAQAQKGDEDADQSKNQRQLQFDKHMDGTLRKYGETVNSYLAKVGAQFSIDKLSGNFRGNAPRCDYKLVLRGKAVDLDGNTTSFKAALSDGDKRALAFAFFMAVVDGDDDLKNCIIVMDDPMTSLDANRRAVTLDNLKRLTSGCKQLIILSHDAFFLRDLRDRLPQHETANLYSEIRLVSVGGDYSDFAKTNLHDLCELPYHRRYKRLTEFANGTDSDASSIAQDLRPFLEEYLRNRFPYQFTNSSFGEAIQLIDESPATSPLDAARCLVVELRRLNEYARNFHHAGDITVNTAELRTMVKCALYVAHHGRPMVTDD